MARRRIEMRARFLSGRGTDPVFTARMFERDLLGAFEGTSFKIEGGATVTASKDAVTRATVLSVFLVAETGEGTSVENRSAVGCLALVDGMLRDVIRGWCASKSKVREAVVAFSVTTVGGA